MFKKLFIIGISIFSMCYADGIAALNKFFAKNLSSLSASFKQKTKVRNKDEIITGYVEISRPNKFRWQYTNDGQEIICNGKNIYIYDRPLKQVTIKKFENTITKSPAMILAGKTNFNDYVIANLATTNNLQWVRLEPKAQAQNFKRIDIAFKDNNLAKMIFTDEFDNVSEIEFNSIKKNIVFKKNNFEFYPPKGTDIINTENS